MPVLATYFSVRRGRDPFFKFFMRTIFPKQVKEYEERFGIRFIGWYNVAHGWDFDNVILLDLRLPDLDGTDVARELRGDARTAEIPVVALSALRLEGREEWLREAGFAGSLAKPIDVAEFPRRVRGYCRA